MKIKLPAFIVLFISLAVYAQPVIDGDMSDVSNGHPYYKTLGTFTSGRDGAGADNELGAIKYRADGNNIYLGITGKVSNPDYLILFFDFSNYKGRRANKLGAGTNTGVFYDIRDAKMDFDVDYALAFTTGTNNNGDPVMRIYGCRYDKNGVVADADLNFTPDRHGTNIEIDPATAFGGSGIMTIAYNNNFSTDANKGIEIEIPISAFNGITNAQAFRVFSAFYEGKSGFKNECIPGDPGQTNPVSNNDFSAIPDQKFYTSFAPMVKGITFEGVVDFYYPGWAWMGDLEDNTPFFHNIGDGTCSYQHPCGFWVNDCGNYAYTQIVWNADGIGNGCSNGSGHVNFCNAVVENTDFLDGVEGITLKFDQFKLAATQRRNWGAPADGPNGIMGDHRIYTNGDGYVYVNGVQKLFTNNNRISLDVEYPAPYGTGDFSFGDGVGNFIAGANDPQWENAFDNGNNQVTYSFYSFSPVIQSIYGAFKFTVILKEGDAPENLAVITNISSGNNYTLTGTGVKIAVNTAELTSGEKKILARECFDDAGGTLPDGVVSKTDYKYWELGTTCESISSNATFDISDIPGISNTKTLVILKRETPDDPWTSYGDVTSPGNDGLSSTQIRANNLLSYSQFTIGSTDGNVLPVELQGFRASIQNGRVLLKWQTATEANNYGFEVERKSLSSHSASPSSNNQSLIVNRQWNKIGFIKGSGNSNSRKDYSFMDKDISISGKYYYRLKQIDNDGKYKYSQEIMIELKVPLSYRLSQNYPNPFNPSTTISYQIPQRSLVSLRIFDLLGRKIKELVNEEKDPGNYNVKFNAAGLPSGTYFYQLKAGEKFMSVKKLMILK